MPIKINCCQSCGMPFDEGHKELIAKEADGRDSIYCTYCYNGGAFTNPKATVNDMIELGVPHLAHKIGEKAARERLSKFVPTLTRWNGKKPEAIVKFKCTICGYVYDESAGVPEKGVTPGTKWESIPDSFACPLCGAPKSAFSPLGEPVLAPKKAAPPMKDAPAKDTNGMKDTLAKDTKGKSSNDKNGAGGLNGKNGTDDLKELAPGEISAICSSLAKGCEKQRLGAETDAFYKIAAYYKTKIPAESGKSLKDAAKLLDGDISNLFPAANEAAKANGDRGALRSLVWSEKVSAMTKSLLERFSKEGEAMLQNTKIWVCDICGFIYIGEAPPEICPVCKVPKFQILQIERRAQ